MIIEFIEGTPRHVIDEIKQCVQGFELSDGGSRIVVTGAAIKRVESDHLQYIKRSLAMDSDIQLASRKYKERRVLALSEAVKIGDGEGTVLIAGPCAIEDERQILSVVKFLVGNNIKFIRAGCFKPRTSPYSFQGLGEDGLRLLRNVADNFNLKIVTEVRDSTHVEIVADLSDVIQIGAKAMYDHGILRYCGSLQKPVLLKRSFGATLQEFVQAAEFILSSGNPNVILCERGIRTFETKTRFTLDLCGVAYLKEKINLPVILDPSHAMGYAYGVPDLARACVALGIDGLMIELHPDPQRAQSDAAQQLDFNQFSDLLPSIDSILQTIGRQRL